MLQQKLISLILLISYFQKGFSYENDYGEYNEEELEEIMCDSDIDCPKHLPKCKASFANGAEFCQWECESKNDCMGCDCIDHK